MITFQKVYDLDMKFVDNNSLHILQQPIAGSGSNSITYRTNGSPTCAARVAEVQMETKTESLQYIKLSHSSIVSGFNH